MEKIISEFGLKLNNIPTINLRIEFANHLHLLGTKKFQEQCKRVGHPIETPYLIWYGMPNALLTIILQRSILGIEAYVTSAAYFSYREMSPGTPEITAKFRNPFSFGGKGTADSFFNRMPALTDSRYQLKVVDPPLWEATKRFYSEVRNPLFHGNEVDAYCVEGVLKAHQHIDQLYWWIDGWHHPEKVMKGFSALSRRAASKEKSDDV